MSELIDNSRMKKETLKHLILQLHEGTAAEAVRAQLVRMLGEVPYGLVVEVEQELIGEGELPVEEVLKLCDVHGAALKGVIDVSAAKEPPAGHPIDILRKENRAIEAETARLAALFREVRALAPTAAAAAFVEPLRAGFMRLLDVDRHYRRKENLLFPYLEKRGISGPSTVMWGKDDEARAGLRGAVEALTAAAGADAESLQSLIALILAPAATAVEEMIYKEEQILFPMSMDHLTEAEWRAISHQSAEIGFCLLDEVPAWGDDPGVGPAAVAGAPAVGARTAGAAASGVAGAPASPSAPGPAAAPSLFSDGFIRMPSGSFTVDELTRVLNLLPFDLTFVDKDDRVRYFTQGAERIFDRNAAILGRKVQQCHPPSSVHVVQQIVDDFRAGRQDRAPFWIQLHGRFIHIEYFAVRDASGGYLGTVEVSQDLTALRSLEGEQRLLSYTAAKE